MRRFLTILLALVAGLALATSAAPADASGKLLFATTTQIGGKSIRFAMVKVDTTVYIRMQRKHDGHWRTIGQDRADCDYWDGSSGARLEVQKADKQVYAYWDGPVEGEAYAEYGGYDVKHERLNMWGADGCPSAG